MGYVYIGICVVLIITIYIFIIFKKNGVFIKNQTIEKINNTKSFIKKSSDKLVIKVEKFPIDAIKDENSLIELTDKGILTRVNNLIPGLIQFGNTTNNLMLAAQATKNEVLYRAIIPAGAKLANSATMDGAVRGFINGAKGKIQDHANFIAVDVNNGAVPVATNSVVAAMGVASIIIGQYYMTKINTELKMINNGISQIQSFLDNEYKSKVFSLIAYIKKIIDFQIEILENDELRLSEILQLDRLEEKCTELLGQAHLTLIDLTKRVDLDYKMYEKTLETVNNWFIYQKILMNVMHKISDLRYILHFGAISRKQCNKLLLIYAKQDSEVQDHLKIWHKDIAKRLSIDIEKCYRKRSGLKEGIHGIIGLIKNSNNYNFKHIEKRTVNMIKAQMSGHNNDYLISTSELYNEDVQLIAKNGKIYYLPNNETK